MAFPEAFLDGMQVPVVRKSFNGGDLCTVSLDSEHRAGFHRLPIDEDGAGAADAGLTSHVRPRQAAHLAQKLDKQQARLDVAFSQHSVYADLDGGIQGGSLNGGTEREEPSRSDVFLSTK